MAWKLRFSVAATVVLLLMMMNQSASVSCAEVVDPTIGFTDLPFDTNHYKIHKPYDVPETLWCPQALGLLYRPSLQQRLSHQPKN